MKIRWPRWDSKGWFARAAAGKSTYKFPDEAQKEEMQRLKLSAPTQEPAAPGQPVVARIPSEFTPQRPTRAEVLERFPR